jgi:hypothetical protein
MFVTPAYIAPLESAAFAINGFPLPEVELTPNGFMAYTVKEDRTGHFAYAVMLSPRSAEDAQSRLAREILRNRQ